MASEILAIKEDNLAFVISILRKGMLFYLNPTPQETKIMAGLEEWCYEEEAYLRRLSGDDDKIEQV